MPRVFAQIMYCCLEIWTSLFLVGLILINVFVLFPENLLNRSCPDSAILRKSIHFHASGLRINHRTFLCLKNFLQCHRIHSLCRFLRVTICKIQSWKIVDCCSVWNLRTFYGRPLATVENLLKFAYNLSLEPYESASFIIFPHPSQTNALPF